MMETKEGFLKKYKKISKHPISANDVDQITIELRQSKPVEVQLRIENLFFAPPIESLKNFSLKFVDSAGCTVFECQNE